MKKMMTAFAAISLAMSTAACGDMAEDGTAASTEAGTLAGTWMANAETAQFENDNRDYLLASGKFECLSCTPPYSVTADGKWRAIDRPGVDSQMIEIVDANTIKSATRFGEKDLGNATWSVSEDGKTLNLQFTDTSGDEPVNGSVSFSRTGDAPAGSHAISGQWTNTGLANLDEAGLKFSYALNGDTVTSEGNGNGWTATLGGDAVPVEGSSSNVMVAIESTGENSYRETYTRDGEVLRTLEISVDGDTMSAVSSDPRDNSVVRWSASRQ